MGANPPIEAVIFDMDGLLLDTERLSMRAIGTAGATLGLDLPPAFCRSMIGSSADLCHAMLRERFGAGFPHADYVAAEAAALRALVEGGELALKRGVAELLDLLDAEGIPRAIATSSSRERAAHHLAAAGLAARFATVVTRDDVVRGKPAPDPYLRAAALLAVAPARCLALEDSHNGVRAAHAAGMRVVMVPDLLEATGEMRAIAHRVVDSLHDVADLIRATRAPA